MDTVRLEVAVDNVQAVLGAAEGGAERLELCSSLADGGLTPSLGFLEWTLAHANMPVHGMVRPRGGNFQYSNSELAVMANDIRAMRRAGAHGIVVGVLNPAQKVHVDATRRLVEAADGMRVCFHRAFDLTADRKQALEDVIRTGAEILLTSGGAATLEAGADEVTRITHQAAGRIEIMGGAGVRISNAAALWKKVPVDTLHASLRTPWLDAGHVSTQAAAMGSRDDEELYAVRAEDVRAVLTLLEPRTVAAR